MELNFRLHLRLTLFLTPVLILSACAPPVPANDAVSDRRASSTPAASPLTAQPTGSQIQSDSIPSPARLTVIRSGAKVFSGAITTDVQRAQSADIQVDDGIEVVQPEGQAEQSYSILHFPDFLNVELFSNTKVFLADVQQENVGSTDITLDLDSGHMFVHLNEETITGVMVQTPYANIKTLTAGAEFNVCRNETLTCVVVKRGVVEITAQDKRAIVKAGEAGVVVDDQPPSPAICASLPGFIAWEERYRQFADTLPLQEEISKLAQNPCPVTADGLPLDARILYRDEFRSPSSGWEQGEMDNFSVRYVRVSGPRYYQVQAQGPEDQFLAFVPDGRHYEDVNVDVKAFTEAATSGDFRYGVVFRRSGNQYYAFAISPSTETWYFLKSSSNGLELLRDGLDKRMRGLEAQDILRVETYGSTFLFYINGRFIDWASDSEYASGEVGLFVETIESPDVRIGFNSIILWDIPAPVLNPKGENCFNASDDDGDGWIDQADPNCQRPELILTSQPTSLPLPTSTPGLNQTPTPAPPATNPPAPTATNQPPPLPTLPVPTDIPTLPLPTDIPTLPPLPLPLPTLNLPLPTIQLPLPTIDLPLPIGPPGGTPTPE